ncbi:proteasome activator [Nonomuraea aridisoli]|uniref:Bacterial proteasome activator n=1 Tax=Nonomuraea aridisoli TaxID=2070368 RepID=A0A2W2DE25_9ACTN|nr:proteasome activator [Nonomuraea aridisoli]PZG10246.1 DUF2587 domain-containing protein [Nonomuraea aridisoli]
MFGVQADEPRIRRSPAGLFVVDSGREPDERAGQGREDTASPPRKEMWPAAELTAMARQDKLVRLATTVRHLCDELREMTLDDQARERLGTLYERISAEISDVLPPELRAELDTLRPSLDGRPTHAELRIAHAQLLGWVEGLWHGVQVAVNLHRADLAQQASALRPGRPGPGKRAR